jgi:hypothetical protein
MGSVGGMTSQPVDITNLGASPDSRQTRSQALPACAVCSEQLYCDVIQYEGKLVHGYCVGLETPVDTRPFPRMEKLYKTCALPPGWAT